MKYIIEFKNVSFRYSENSPWVVKDCSFAIKENSVTAIIGHNGSGKSTISKLMNGLLFPQKGEIWVNGSLLTEESVWEIRKQIGMVFQNPDNQFVGATVRDDVAFGMENRGIEREEMVGRINDSLTTVKMTDYLLTEPHRLSGGQKQRVAIAGIIAIEPKVIVLDEATVMLDPKGRAEIMQTMSDLQATKDITLITVTHDLHEISQVEHVIVLNQGEIWKQGTPREVLLAGDNLQKIGLAIPFTMELTNALNKYGINLEEQALTNEELLDNLSMVANKDDL